jgi:hypothetical protein
MPSSPAPSFTPKQGQYLAFIYAYTRVLGRSPAEADKTVLANGRVVALGLNAIQALAGASEAIRHWNARLARDGLVRIRDTTALGKRSDGITPSLVDYFGDALAKTP